ncbi:hypothetical protein B0H14DRAFT_2174534, partial [Mycena olivaceomarginata]
KETPDIYLFELQNALAEATGLDVDKNTIRDALFRRGYTRKVVSRSAIEADDPPKRLGYQCEVGKYRAWQLVFLDESACN